MAARLGRSCTFDFEHPDVPNCLYKMKSGGMFVVTKYIRELSFNEYGLAPLLSDNHEWMYVNRRGKVVITGVAWMDNGADDFHDGLVRVVRAGKFGFSNRSGKIVVPAVYDGAFGFKNGVAEVCKGCSNECEDEHCAFVGGDWLRIDTAGRPIGKPNGIRTLP
jgi:hypothetical protein